MKVAIVGRVTEEKVAAMRAFVSGLPTDTVVIAPHIPSTAYTQIVLAANARGLQVVKLKQPEHHNGRHILESSGRFVLSTEVMKQADQLVVFNDKETMERNEPLFGVKKDLLRDLVEFQVRHGKAVQWL